MRSYSNSECGETIICPYCGAEYEPTYEETYIGDTEIDCYEETEQECTCDDCGKRFTVRPVLTWEYETETIKGQMTEADWEERYG